MVGGYSASKIYFLITEVIVIKTVVVRWCRVNFQCRDALLIWISVGQGPIALAVGAGGVVWTVFLSYFSFLSPSLWETARYRLKYCLKGPLSPKQPTNTLL